jgi:two-component system, chemotaxis family, CheB/CheR fusion protein
VFRKVARQPVPNAAYFGEPVVVPPREELGGFDHLRNETFMNSPVAQIVVTADGLVVLTNRQAETLFGVSSRDLGRPFRDLDVSYRPVELRRHIEQAQVERRSVRVPNVELIRGGEHMYLEVHVIPVVDGESGLLGVTLVFQDVTEARRLQDELEHANRQLESAYEELQSTNEELETTNEELQSTVEELETTNEELQSTNEELETMNEELQSTNDELQNINDQLSDSSAKLDEANAFLDAVLTSLKAGVAVLNRDLQIQAWNRRAEDLWGLRREEAIGEHFLTLDIGLPTDQLRPVIRQILADGGGPLEVELDAVNRRGRAIRVRIEAIGLTDSAGGISGAVLVMEDDAEN